MSTLYICLKYPFLNGGVKVIQGDQETVKRCYFDSLKIKMETMVVAHAQQLYMKEVNVVDLKPKTTLNDEDLAALFQKKVKVVDNETIQMPLFYLGIMPHFCLV